MRRTHYGTLAGSPVALFGREQSTDDCRANLFRPDTTARVLEMPQIDETGAVSAATELQLALSTVARYGLHLFDVAGD